MYFSIVHSISFYSFLFFHGLINGGGGKDLHITFISNKLWTSTLCSFSPMSLAKHLISLLSQPHQKGAHRGHLPVPSNWAVSFCSALPAPEEIGRRMIQMFPGPAGGPLSTHCERRPQPASSRSAFYVPESGRLSAASRSIRGCHIVILIKCLLQTETALDTRSLHLPL